jgi:hypothetical protein
MFRPHEANHGVGIRTAAATITAKAIFIIGGFLLFGLYRHTTGTNMKRFRDS